MRFNHRQLRDATTKVKQAERAARRRASRWSAVIGLVAGAAIAHVYAHHCPAAVQRVGDFTRDVLIGPAVTGCVELLSRREG